MKRAFKAPQLIKVIRGMVRQGSIDSTPDAGATSTPISSSWASAHVDEVNEILAEIVTLLERLTEAMEDEVEYDDLPIINELFEDNKTEEDIL